MSLQPTEVLVPQVFPFNLSINVLPVVSDEGLEVRETVTLTLVEPAGAVNLYHTSFLLPQLEPPAGVVAVAWYNVPAFIEQSAPTVSVVAAATVQASFPGWAKEKYDNNNKRTGRNRFFIGWTFTIWVFG